MKRLLILLLAAVLLSACKTAATPTLSRTPTLELAASPPSTATLTPTITPTPRPDARARAEAFLSAWKADDYPAMYALLSTESQAALSLEDLTNHMSGVEIEAALESIDYEILSVEETGPQASARYRVTFHSNLVPDFMDETGMTLLLEGDEWRVKWEDTIVMSLLSGSNYLSMNRNDYTPARGVIFDRDGKVIAGNADIYAVGLDMLAYDPGYSDAVISTLAALERRPSAKRAGSHRGGDIGLNAISVVRRISRRAGCGLRGRLERPVRRDLEHL